MTNEQIKAFEEFSNQLYDSGFINAQKGNDNFETTRERINQLVFNEIDKDKLDDVISRFIDNPMSYTILNYLDLVFFDVLNMARPDNIHNILNDKKHIVNFLHQTNCKMEFILYVFENYTENDEALKVFFLNHLTYINQEFSWFKADVDNLFNSFNLDNKEQSEVRVLLSIYKEALENILICYVWFSTPTTEQTETLSTNYEYSYLGTEYSLN